MYKFLTLILIISSMSVFGQKTNELTVPISEYDQAIKLNPNNASAYYNRGTSRVEIKDFKAAIADFDKAIELKSDFLNAYKNRGIAKIKLNDIKGAISDYDTAIKLDPKDASLYFTRAQFKFQANDNNSGCEDLLKAKELGEKRADSYIKHYCRELVETNKVKVPIESIMMDWPDSEGWRIANESENKEEKLLELLRNNETFENWTEIGTVHVYKTITSLLKVPISRTADYLFSNTQKAHVNAKLTIIEKDERAKYPWMIFKIDSEDSSNNESQVWLIMQGTDELFVSFRAVKQKAVPKDLVDKWVQFFKGAKIVTQ